MRSERPKWGLPASDWPCIALVLLVTFVAFLPALQADFVRWDDNVNFLGNPNFRGFGMAQLRWMWTTTLLGHYVPISWMTLGLDYTLWGMDGRGYHLTNLILHASSAVVLYYVGMRLFRTWPPGREPAELRIPLTAAVLVFAVHPLRVESVAWVTERRDVLSLLFMLGSALLYLKWLESRRVVTYLTAIALFGIALLSKASVVTLPLVLLLLSVRKEKDGGLRAFDRHRDLLPFFGLSLAAGLISFSALKKPEQLPFIDKLAVSGYGIGFYLWKSLIPTGLSPLYAMPKPFHALAPKFLFCYAVAAAAVSLAWFTRKRAPALITVLVCALAISLPLLGVVQNGPQLAADRYTYHASAALSLVVALVILRWPSGLMYSGAAAAVVSLAALTFRQSEFWVNSDRLWERVVAVDSTSAVAQIALGDLRVSERRYDEAIAHYERGVALSPDYAEGHNNIGVLLAGRREFAKAIPHYQRALELKPDYAEARLNYGVALGELHLFDAAVPQLAEAVRLAPHLNAATAYLAAAKEAVRVQKSLPPASQHRQ